MQEPTTTVYALIDYRSKQWESYQYCRGIYATLALLKKANPGTWHRREDYPDQWEQRLADETDWPGFTHHLHAKPIKYYA
jgi:hypothetical protein